MAAPLAHLGNKLAPSSWRRLMHAANFRTAPKLMAESPTHLLLALVQAEARLALAPSVTLNTLPTTWSSMERQAYVVEVAHAMGLGDALALLQLLTRSRATDSRVDDTSALVVSLKRELSEAFTNNMLPLYRLVTRRQDPPAGATGQSQSLSQSLSLSLVEAGESTATSLLGVARNAQEHATHADLFAASINFDMVNKDVLAVKPRAMDALFVHPTRRFMLLAPLLFPVYLLQTVPRLFDVLASFLLLPVAVKRSEPPHKYMDDLTAAFVAQFNAADDGARAYYAYHVLSNGDAASIAHLAEATGRRLEDLQRLAEPYTQQRDTLFEHARELEKNNVFTRQGLASITTNFDRPIKSVTTEELLPAVAEAEEALDRVAWDVAYGAANPRLWDRAVRLHATIWVYLHAVQFGGAAVPKRDALNMPPAMAATFDLTPPDEEGFRALKQVLVQLLEPPPEAVRVLVRAVHHTARTEPAVFWAAMLDLAIALLTFEWQEHFDHDPEGLPALMSFLLYEAPKKRKGAEAAEGALFAATRLLVREVLGASRLRYVHRLLDKQWELGLPALLVPPPPPPAAPRAVPHAPDEPATTDSGMEEEEDEDEEKDKGKGKEKEKEGEGGEEGQSRGMKRAREPDSEPGAALLAAVAMATQEIEALEEFHTTYDRTPESEVQREFWAAVHREHENLKAARPPREDTMRELSHVLYTAADAHAPEVRRAAQKLAEHYPESLDARFLLDPALLSLDTLIFQWTPQLAPADAAREDDDAIWMLTTGQPPSAFAATDRVGQELERRMHGFRAWIRRLSSDEERRSGNDRDSREMRKARGALFKALERAWSRFRNLRTDVIDDDDTQPGAPERYTDDQLAALEAAFAPAGPAPNAAAYATVRAEAAFRLRVSTLTRAAVYDLTRAEMDAMYVCAARHGYLDVEDLLQGYDPTGALVARLYERTDEILANGQKSGATLRIVSTLHERHAAELGPFAAADVPSLFAILDPGHLLDDYEITRQRSPQELAQWFATNMPAVRAHRQQAAAWLRVLRQYPQPTKGGGAYLYHRLKRCYERLAAIEAHDARFQAVAATAAKKGGARIFIDLTTDPDA